MFHSGQRYAIATETTPLPDAAVGLEVMTTLFEIAPQHHIRSAPRHRRNGQ